MLSSSIQLPWRVTLVSILLLFAAGPGCQTTPSAEADAVAAPPAAEGSNEAVDAELDAARQEAQASRRQLDLDHQALQIAAWQHVKSITRMWSELPPEFFPGLARLVAEVEELRQTIESEDSLMVGLIEPEILTTANPSFWRAVMETAPEDPVVELFQQMLWAARGNFERASWLIELHRYGPALPSNVHRLVYSMAEEMRRLQSRRSARRRGLIQNLTAEEIGPAVATTRSFQPQDPDWTLMSILVRLQQAGVSMSDLNDNPDLVDHLMTQMHADWELVARANPMMGAQLNPDQTVRRAASVLTDQLGALGESRGAFGGRDVIRLSQVLAESGLYAEALLAQQRAAALRGFSVPSDIEDWWQWLPEMIGEEETAKLREAAWAGLIRPVAFFETETGPEGVSLLPLHPILVDRNLRRLQEVQRQLTKPGLGSAEKATALVTQAETLAHLGRWEEARAALGAVPEEFQETTAPMQVWVSLWSGQIESIEEQVAALEEEARRISPALPALAKAAIGEWQQGVDIFLAAAETANLHPEFRTYYTLMASAFARLAGEEQRADNLIEQARQRGEGHEWVSALARGMAGEPVTEALGRDRITEIIEAGRICEQRFYTAFQRNISPVRQQALLEGCVATGVVDFVEYTASLLRLRELDPERWDPAQASVRESSSPEESEDSEDWTRGAHPTWTMPS